MHESKSPRLIFLIWLSAIGLGILLTAAASVASADFSEAEHVSADRLLAQSFDQHRSHVQVADAGIVIELLPDDLQGDRHQRFLVQLANGQRLLFAYNIDIAPRIDALRRGDSIEFSGEYIWNRKGGIVHWTHHDPSGRHDGGFIRLDGRVYQ